MKNPISYNNSIVWLNWSKTAGIDLTFDFQLKNRNASIKISLSESSIRTEIKDTICIWKQVLIHQRLVIGNVSTTRMKGTKTEQTRNWEAIEAYEKQTSTTQEKQSKVKQMREKKPSNHPQVFKIYLRFVFCWVWNGFLLSLNGFIRYTASKQRILAYTLGVYDVCLNKV